VMYWFALAASIVMSTTKIVVVYDNESLNSDLEKSWGFACYVEHRGTKVLFDTGASWRVLEHNADGAGVALDELDGVFISHLHGDHTGCIENVARLNRKLKIALPASGSDGLAKKLRALGHEVVRVRDAGELWPGLRSTGELYGPPHEQGLIVEGDDWMALVVGCSHPGVDEMAAKARLIVDKNFLLVIGGFHLFSSNRSKVEAIIDKLSELGVKRVAPCHCTGRASVLVFKQRLPDAYIPCGVGLKLRLP